MEDKQFDEALVERVAKALHALGFISPSPSSTEVSELWDKSPTNYKIMHHIQAKYVLSALSSTHAIVPRNSDEERDAAADLATCEASAKYDYNRASWDETQAYGEFVRECAKTIAPYWIKRCLAKEASPHA